MKKRILLVCVALLSLTYTFAWDGTNSAPLTGDGGSSTPYQITTANELAWMAANIATVGGKYFKLMNDIDLSGGVNWTPIGNSTTGFTGNFNGNYHVISNMTYSGSGVGNIALFGIIGANATITNLGLNNYNINITNSGTNKNFAGLVGNASAGPITISGCYANGTLSVSGITTNGVDIAGFIAQETGAATVTDCYTRSNVTAIASSSMTAAFTAISGFAGALNTSTDLHTNCYASGAVTITPVSTSQIIKNDNIFAGFLGVSTSQFGSFTNCYTDQTTGYQSGNTGQGTTSTPPTNVTIINTTAFHAPTMPATLGANWVADNGTNPINGGYPVLNWQLGTPVAIAASSINTTGFTAYWGVTTGAASYTLEVATDNGFGTIVQTIPSITGTSQVVNSLTAGTNYYYRVRATNLTSGQSSSNSNIITEITSIATATKEAVPNNMKAITTNGILRVENADSYTVYNVAGLKVADINKNTCSTNVKLKLGVYIVKSGAQLQKIVVN